MTLKKTAVVILLSSIFCMKATFAKTFVFQNSGTINPVVDGWVHKGVKDAGSNYGDFTSDFAYVYNAATWGTSSALIKFDLSNVKLNKNEDVNSAILSLYAYEVEAAGPYKLYQIGPDAGWNTKATYYNYDGMKDWPNYSKPGGDTQVYSSRLDNTEVTFTIDKVGDAGWVNIDVTDIVNNWLDNGAPNMGFIISTHAYSSGFASDAIGKIKFYTSRHTRDYSLTPKLIVKTGPAKPKEAQKPVSVKYAPPVPRWQLAPINNPYFFAWWNATKPSDSFFASNLPRNYQTIDCFVEKPEDQMWMLGRGIMAFTWSWGTQFSGPYNSADDYEQYILEYVKKGVVGICIDEWVGSDINEDEIMKGTPEKHMYPGNPKNRMLAEACRRIKQNYPDFFIVACTHMQSESLINCLKNGWVDFAIIESYPYVMNEPDWKPELAMWRLNNAKNFDVMEKTIPAFWIMAEDPNFTEEWLEGWVKTWRKEFPQMPGIAPLFPGEHDKQNDQRYVKLIRACERIIKKYYIDPAPKVDIVKPHDGEIISKSAAITINAKADKSVAIWRLFVGNKLVAEQTSDSNEVTFKPKDLLAGSQILTVHAITADWDRGATQIEVFVGEPNSQP